jgi:hypothetical protein
MSDSFGQRFWQTVCGFQTYLFQLFVVLVVLLVLVVFAAVLVDPGSPAYAVVLLDVGVLVPTTVAIGYALFRCSRR